MCSTTPRRGSRRGSDSILTVPGTRRADLVGETLAVSTEARPLRASLRRIGGTRCRVMSSTPRQGSLGTRHHARPRTLTKPALTNTTKYHRGACTTDGATALVGAPWRPVGNGEATYSRVSDARSWPRRRSECDLPNGKAGAA